MPYATVSVRDCVTNRLSETPRGRYPAPGIPEDRERHEPCDYDRHDYTSRP